MRRKLGSMEMAQAISNEIYGFNVVAVLNIINGPSEETLRNVSVYLQRRHPLLGVHIKKEKGWYLYVSEGTPGIPLTVVERQSSDHWQQVVEQELRRKFDMFTGPLVRFTYLTGPKGQKEREIIITFQHSLIDAVSGGSLLHEILSLCEAVESRGTIDPLEIFEPLPAVDAFFPPAFKGFRRKWNLFLFMFRQIGDEFLFQLRTRGRRKAPVHREGACKILPMKLSKELTSALLKSSRKKRITLNSLLNAALLMVVQKHLYAGQGLPLRLINTADLRPYLIPPLDAGYFGSYFSMMRFTVRVKENPNVWELAHELNDLIYVSLKRGDKFCAVLFSYRMMRMLFRFKSFRMAAAALSFTGSLQLENNYGKINVQDFHAYPSNFVVGPEYSAAARLFNNQIYWDILYLDSDMDQNRAGVLANDIRTILESAVEEEL